MATMPQLPTSTRIFPFVNGASDGNKGMKQLLGGKGANLCEMAKHGLDVPPGFVISTEVCEQFYGCNMVLPPGLMPEVQAAIQLIAKDMKETFACPDHPLLLSVRSGAAVSMPGMMDTVLNLGLNDSIVKGLAKQQGDRFALDCYRRLLHMFGDVVLGIPHEDFEACLSQLKHERGATLDIELGAQDLSDLVQRYKQVYVKYKKELPEDPWEQLRMSIDAVFRSWNLPRAVKYREINRIAGLKGTAVTIQAMVFGNLTEATSGTGVCFTRNPANGEKMLFGEFLTNAQGEDVVAGIRTPLPIKVLEQQMPAVYKELVEVTTRLEQHMKDMQDIEFTVQDSRLFMLQTRSGKRTGTAALQVATDMFKEGLVSKPQAILMVEPRHLDQLLHPQFRSEQEYRDAGAVVGTGLAASPGAAVGRIVFTAADAEAWHERGEQVLLLRTETSPEDVGGMNAAEGICTSRGGMTSHAAVVARGWGKPCVAGCEDLHVDDKEKVLRVYSKDGAVTTYREGEWFSLNGTSGEVVRGRQVLKDPEISGNLKEFMGWVDAARRMQVWANADTPADAAVALANGAQGLGLVRTEHMFFSSPRRIAAMRRMIAAAELGSPAVSEALLELQGYQQEDFEGIFRAMHGLPVTVRLLDPPLHEFLPQSGPALDDLCQQLAGELSTSCEAVRSRLGSMHETNPMMGLRGCRLGLVHPEITEMQSLAIFQAAASVLKEGIPTDPKVMVPLVGSLGELTSQVQLIRGVAARVQAEQGVNIPYHVGTMIEVPRGALQAGQLATVADFFSFGTNDLTQMTFGVSRDDANFLTHYVHTGILARDPFETLDEEGVGELVQLAVAKGRAAKPGIELGICGEHGGDPRSIAFFEKVGLDYVSCSPLRVPIARLAAAQASIKGAHGRAPHAPLIVGHA